jgi:NMD protein affecting ribosome stability and mRNA decay
MESFRSLRALSVVSRHFNHERTRPVELFFPVGCGASFARTRWIDPGAALMMERAAEIEETLLRACERQRSRRHC